MVFSLDEHSESIVPEILAKKEWSLGTQVAKVVNDEIAKGNLLSSAGQTDKILKWASICFHPGRV